MHETEPHSSTDIVKELTAPDSFHEISKGFFTNRAAVLIEVYVKLMQKRVYRMPIIGTTDDRIFLLADLVQNDHATLLGRLNQKLGYTIKNIKFTTSLESLTIDLPNPPYLVLPNQGKNFHIRVGKGSDQLPEYPLGNTDLSALFSGGDIKLVGVNM